MRKSRQTAGGHALGLRVCWWVLVACDAVLVVDVIAAARLFDRPAIYLSLIGPLYFGGALGLIAWWHSGRRRRAR